MTQGATQFNHARQTSAAKLSIDCRLLLDDRAGYTDLAYTDSGNALLGVLHGASFEMRGPDLDMYAQMEAVADQPCEQGPKVYRIILVGAIELIQQEQFEKNKRVVFSHTRGSAALFGDTHFLNNSSARKALVALCAAIGQLC